MRNDDAWFVRSAIGYSFRPVRWPGWLLMAGYIAMVMLLTWLPARLDILRVALIVIATIAVVIVAARTARLG
ncbi:hypothetical protein GCM10022268_34910 [Sphingomonas cynarae]|uniref:DUF4175 domain-containing protein n=1 Tax=Sphingomonas cynarae TaxID=930197 RepID=A0ABP7EU23_9SPHN